MTMLKPKRLTRPDRPVISLAEAKAHMIVEHNDDDAIISGFIAAAEAQIDGYDGELCLALVNQQWSVSTWTFADTCIRLPLGPLVSIDAITYWDSSDVEQTVPDTNYRDHEDVCGPYVKLVDGASWPTDLARRDDAVTITFTAGHGTPGDVPEEIRQALLLTIADWYAFREQVQVGSVASEIPIPMAAQSLLFKYTRAPG